MYQSPLGLCVAERGAPNRASTTGCHFYIREILAHAGLWHAEAPSESLADALAPEPRFPVVIIAGDAGLSPDSVRSLEEFVRNGGAAIGVGSASGAYDLWGVEPEMPPAGFGIGSAMLGEGYIQPADAGHPIVQGMQSSLHFFNGAAVRATTAATVAEVLDAHHRPTGRAAITVQRIGRGIAILIAPDIPGSVALIQQGRYVEQDGRPAPDGTAPVTDNLLKADDGIVLDWDFDRSTAEGVPYPFFLHPVADELREILLRAIFYAASTVGFKMPLLWYYPRNLPALAHLSHDSDGNDPALADRMLEVVSELELRDTWCIQKPGYPSGFYDALREAGQEIALHYDALELGELSEWGEIRLRQQHEWLVEAAGQQAISTNKNHYTRWEGRLEFLRWCGANGITCDQTRGPSKIGETGFPFGTAHAWFPMEDSGELIDCLEIGFQSQDFVVFGPPDIIEPLVVSAARHHGIAHVIFHPAHICKEGVESALRRYVRLGREQGMEFWTSADIARWERARRRVRLIPSESSWHVVSEAEMPGATILTLCAAESGTQTARRYGFDFHVRIGDLCPGIPLAITVPATSRR